MARLIRTILDEKRFENRLLLTLILFSLVTHITFYLSYINKWLNLSFTKAPEEFVIVADLITEFTDEDNQQALKNAVKADEILIDKKTLPQLPKNFTAKEKPLDPKEETIPDIKKQEVELAEKENPDPKDLHKQLLDRLRKKKEQKLLQLEKEEIKKRKLKELARREKKFADINKSPLDKTLLDRKNQLADASAVGTNLDRFSSYVSTIRLWVQKKYTVPQIYTGQNITNQAIIEIILDHQGSLKEVKLEKSSQNSAFDRYALKTMQNASPFPKPPRELVGVPIKYRFDHNF